jgi:Potential Queuosine, Q, salvage protein family
MRTIFQDIRDAAEEVANISRWVKVDEIALNLYPERLLTEEKIVLDHTEEHHLLGQGDDTLRFFVILDSINFGSGYFPFLDKDAGVSGYFTVAARLKRHCEAHGVPTAIQLAGISKSDCFAIFEQEASSLHLDELMELFASALRELGEWSLRCFDGDLIGFLKRARTANDAVNMLMEMPYFQDVERYGSLKVPLLKRAQIMLQDIKLADPNHAYIQLPDLDDLTVFADNILPYVFNADEILQYDPWLSERIANEEIIGSGSVEEIEMRACSIYVAERVSTIIKEEIKSISVRELDYMIWNRGQKLKKISNKKRHRTRCVYY